MPPPPLLHRLSDLPLPDPLHMQRKGWGWEQVRESRGGEERRKISTKLKAARGLQQVRVECRFPGFLFRFFSSDFGLKCAQIGGALRT